MRGCDRQRCDANDVTNQQRRHEASARAGRRVRVAKSMPLPGTRGYGVPLALSVVRATFLAVSRCRRTYADQIILDLGSSSTDSLGGRALTSSCMARFAERHSGYAKLPLFSSGRGRHRNALRLRSCERRLSPSSVLISPPGGAVAVSAAGARCAHGEERGHIAD